MSVACYMFILYVIIFKRIIRKAKMLEKDEVERIKSKNVYFFSFLVAFLLFLFCGLHEFFNQRHQKIKEMGLTSAKLPYHY